MESNHWLRQRREEVGINSLVELARRLDLEGFNYTPGAIGHWENGRNYPPLNNPEFREALARVLRLSEGELLRRAGFKPTSQRSEQAEIAADIVDTLPPEKRDLAIRLLEQLRAN